MSYTRSQRRAHAEQAIVVAAGGGWLAQTSCTHICNTYGCRDFTAELKTMKAKLFPEFAINGEGK